jgi:predicted Fe-Mo cluster-binding NifX family protein
LQGKWLEQDDIFNSGGLLMKIAITSNGSSLDDQIVARFGRCPYFIFVNPDTLEFESISNPNMSLGGGAGPQSAQLMAEKGISVVLTGNCGPNAFQTFGAAGIQVITGVGGSRWFSGMEDNEAAVSSNASQISDLSGKEEIESLKQIAQNLRRQFEAIERRLNVLTTMG